MYKSKIFICALVCLLATASAVAQTSVVVKQPHSSKAESTLIKERPGHYPQTVTCVNVENDTACFILYDSNMHCSEVKLVNYYVNDMYVTGDSVFFCGHSIVENTTQGMIGYFDIDNVYSGSGAIYTQDYFAVDPYHVSSDLFRMDVYVNSSGKRCVTCVGTCKYGTYNYPFIVCMEPGLFSGYVAGYVDDKNETFSDVKCFESDYFKRLITSGFDDSRGHYISLRIYKIDDLFDPAGPQDMRYTFSMDTSGIREWVGNEVLLQQVDKTKVFSTLSYRLAMPGCVPISSNVHLGFYDISLLMSGSLYSMVDQIEIPMANANQRLINQFIVRPSTRTLAFLKTFTPISLGVETSVFCELEYPSVGNPGTLRAYSYHDNIMQGMSLFNGNSQYVMSGYLRTSPDRLKYEMETFGFSPRCAEDLKYEPRQPSPVASTRQKKEFVHVYGIALVDAHYSEVSELEIEPECDTTGEPE